MRLSPSIEELCYAIQTEFMDKQLYLLHVKQFFFISACVSLLTANIRITET